MNAEKIEGRRKTFAEKIAEGHTATEAYLLAGYRPLKRETAHRAASRLYANPEVRTYIRELRHTGDELDREETTLTIAKKLAFLARLVLTSSTTLREGDPLIQSHRILKDGSTSIRIPCKLKALKMHSELAGHFLPEPSEPPPPIDTLQELFDQIRSGRIIDATDNGLPRPATSGEADLSKNAPSSTTPASRANANLTHDQFSKPLQTTTIMPQPPGDETRSQATLMSRPAPVADQNPEPREPNPPPPPPKSDSTPLTPVQVRKTVIAQIQQDSPLSYSNLPTASRHLHSKASASRPPALSCHPPYGAL